MGVVHGLAVSPGDEGRRLDQYLAAVLPDLSRSLISEFIRTGLVLVGNLPQKAAYRIKSGDAIAVTVPPPVPVNIAPEEVSFQVLFEDADLIVISKPPGLVVHPACGHQSGTLVHGLLYYCDDLSGINGEERPGIVHRLDKDTSGVMVAAKNDKVHRALVGLFKARQVEKIYHALVDGRPSARQGQIDLPIGRHPANRKKMAVVAQGGREAVTFWEVVFDLPRAFTLLEVRPATGRTHQIRVHMAHNGYPVAGDTVYGRKNPLYADLQIVRQCLHASTLGFVHPMTGRPMRFEAPLWPDMQKAIALLQKVG